MPRWFRFALLLLAALSPRAAAAHGVSPGVGDFLAGVLGLLTSPADVLSWLALGLFAGMHAPRPAGWCAELFASGLVLGLAGARAGLLPPAHALIDLTPFSVCGVLMATAQRLPALPLLMLAGAAGIIRGWHNGGDTLTRPDIVALAAGLALTGYGAVVSVAAATGWFLRGTAAWRLVALRAAGSWITAIAVILGGFALRR